jgi:hypothetical protein
VDRGCAAAVTVGCCALMSKSLQQLHAYGFVSFFFPDACAWIRGTAGDTPVRAEMILEDVSGFV